MFVGEFIEIDIGKSFERTLYQQIIVVLHCNFFHSVITSSVCAKLMNLLKKEAVIIHLDDEILMFFRLLSIPNSKTIRIKKLNQLKSWDRKSRILLGKPDCRT